MPLDVSIKRLKITGAILGPSLPKVVGARGENIEIKDN